MAGKISRSTMITWTLILALGLVLVAVKYQGRSKADRLSQLEGLTTGTVKTIEENDNIVKGENENNVVVDSYTIEFEYTVDGIVHYGRDDIEGLAKYESFIREIIESNFKVPVTVKYDIDDPAVSLIVPPDLSGEN